MALGLFKSEKVVDPTIHDAEENINISMGVHILSDCKNVSVSGKAVILEAINTTFKEVSGKAFIQMFDNCSIECLYGKARIGLLKSGYIGRFDDFRADSAFQNRAAHNA